jgi:hypothetical protein
LKRIFAVKNIDREMDNDLIAVVVLGLLAGGGIVFRRWYLRQPRTYKVSEQVSGTRKLTITEHNPRFETATIEVGLFDKVLLKEDIQTAIEFIDKKNEFVRYSLEDLGIDEIELKRSDDNKSFSCTFEKRDLMRGIRAKGISLYRFRFVLLTDSMPFLKSHVFAFSTKYMLFRPDSGRYN